MAKIDQLFRIMFQQQASDLHVGAESSAYLRLNGEMTKLDMKPLSNEEVQQLIFEILTEKQKRQFVETWELDFSYTVENLARFRCNVFMQRRGMAAVFRLIPEKIRTAEELGLPKEVIEMTHAHKGLICVTGPTGSGKSTTLAALIHYINLTRKAHIITIEDPIEFVHANALSLINQREISSHTKSFANALRASLREDPDIILVGEMRDLETIQLAMTAAETGHLVFGTLHTSSAHKTVDRIIDVFPDQQQEQVRVQLSESLRGVVSQLLLPKIDGTSRVPAFEVMINSKAISNLIREGKTFQIPSTMQITRTAGNISMENALEINIQKGLITRDVANEYLGKAQTYGEDPAAEAAKSEASSGGFNTGGTNPTAQNPTTQNRPSATPPPNPSGFSGLASRFKKSS